MTVVCQPLELANLISWIEVRVAGKNDRRGGAWEKMVRFLVPEV